MSFVLISPFPPAFVAIVVPNLGIRCFFWFLLFVRTFSVPSLVPAASYVGSDIWYLNVDASRRQ